MHLTANKVFVTPLFPKASRLFNGLCFSVTFSHAFASAYFSLKGVAGFVDAIDVCMEEVWAPKQVFLVHNPLIS